MLACRISEGRSITGRESLLAAVDWKENEWPVIDAATLQYYQEPPNVTSIETHSTAAWVCLRDAKTDQYSIQGNKIKVKAESVELTSPSESAAFLGQRQRKIEGTARVTILNPKTEVRLRAGLALYKDEHRHIAIMVDLLEELVLLESINRAQKSSQKETRNTPIGEKVSLRIDYTELSLHLSFKSTGASWCTLGVLDTSVMIGFDFTGPVIGVFAIGDDVHAKFENFEIDSIMTYEG